MQKKTRMMTKAPACSCKALSVMPVDGLELVMPPIKARVLSK